MHACRRLRRRLYPSCQLQPGRNPPMRARSAGRRGEDEDLGEVRQAFELAAVLDGACRSAEPDAGGLLASESDGARAVAAHTRLELLRVELVLCDRAVHTAPQLRHVGEADAEREQLSELAGLVSAWRQPDLMQRAPEPVAATRVVLPQLSGTLARCRADENDAEVECEEVGELVTARQNLFLFLTGTDRGSSPLYDKLAAGRTSANEHLACSHFGRATLGIASSSVERPLHFADVHDLRHQSRFSGAVRPSNDNDLLHGPNRDVMWRLLQRLVAPLHLVGIDIDLAAHLAKLGAHLGHAGLGVRWGQTLRV
jgi:hypothetical protein